MDAAFLWFFWFYSFIGWGLERLFAWLTRSSTRARRCLLLLPLCPVYGLGMLAVLALPPLDAPRLILFGGLAATAVEYAFHWAGERFLHLRFWDYRGLPGNLKGRVCLPFTAAWGVLVWAALRFVQPGLEALAAALPPSAAYAFLLLFTADCVCTLRFLRVTGDLRALRHAFSPAPSG